MSAPANWYRDPTGRYNIRYWDGQQWTDQANSGGSNAVDPVPENIRYVAPAPGTEVAHTPAAPAPSQPTMQEFRGIWNPRSARPFSRAPSNHDIERN